MAREEVDLYPSRTGATTRILPRHDPVVSSPQAPGPWLPPRLLQYQHDGYLRCDAVFDATEIARLEAAVSELLSSDRVMCLPEVILEPNSNAVRSIFRPHALSERVADVVFDPRLVAIAQQILGTSVYVHQCHVNLKPAFTGKELFWHSDFETWHVEDGLPHMRAVSIAVNITENNEFNGPLMVIPGSHRQFVSCSGLMPPTHHEQSPQRPQNGMPSFEVLAKLARENGVAAPKGPPGAITVFDCNLMLGSGANISPYPQCNLFVVYNSTDNAPRAPYSGLGPRPTYIANREIVPLSV